ncbi:hypothetical protein ACE193_17785 [Bernardetia sp. OM2101]|uniref:hypothetical protein n=1 Tax=Bernardetia sp. OM2101 TaxID=3344876 RepID=UPI0035CEA108
MCDFDKEFKLCTCENQETQHRKNTRKYKKENQNKDTFVWTLYTYKGKLESFMDGMMALPSDKIGKQELSLDYVIHQLNSKNCFDFEYSPKEGDYLVIEIETKNWNSEIMPFIYRENKWIFDVYNPFDEMTEEIKKGKLVFIDKNPPT